MLIKNIQWFLLAGLIITRVIDMVSTYLVTPRLISETNPVVRKFKWPSAWLTLLLALVPLISIQAGIVILTMSMLSSSLNIRKIWMMRAIGEEQYLAIIKDSVRKNGVLKILFLEGVSALFWIFSCLLLWFLTGFQPNNYGFWFGAGLGAYGILMFSYYSSYMMSLKKAVAGA